MNIIDHGKWVPYEPQDPPDLWPKNVLFLRRESDGRDWYQYVKDGNIPPGIVKFQALFQETYNGYVIGPAVLDATMLFPRDQYVGEITDYTGNNPQADFGGKLYDPVAGTITDKVEPTPPEPLGQVLERLSKRLAVLEGK